MLQQVSWSNYWVAIAVILGCYYLTWALVFYRTDIRNLIIRFTSNQQAGADDLDPPPGGDPGQGLEELIGSIDTILDGSGKVAARDQVIAQIKEALASYDGMHIPAYRSAVLKHVLERSKENGVELSEEELASGG